MSFLALHRYRFEVLNFQIQCKTTFLQFEASSYLRYKIYSSRVNNLTSSSVHRAKWFLVAYIKSLGSFTEHVFFVTIWIPARDKFQAFAML